MKTFLCVAEKTTVAETASKILSKDNFQVQLTSDKCIKNNFQCSFQNDDVKVIFTSFKGFLFKLEFQEDKKDWNEYDPYNLFTSEVTWSPQSSSIHINLEKILKESDYLLLWLDNDHEGEILSEEVEKVCLNSIQI